MKTSAVGGPVAPRRSVCGVLRQSLGALVFVLSGCLGPPVLERQVLGYDDVTKTLDEQLLLVNIARIDNGESIHFTATSSIAATFDWTTTLGASGRVLNSPDNFLDLNVGASASENPTFSIVPVSGEEFTRRIVTPFGENTSEFVVFQGGRIDQVLRLMAAGIEVQTPDGAFERFIENDPRRPREYEEFRRIAMHLQWLNDTRQLFVRPLVFDETLIVDFTDVPRAEDINNGFAQGLRWRQKPDGNYQLTRLSSGRVIVSNFDPMALSDRERFALNERIRRNPAGFVYLDIQPTEQGGLSIQGAIKLRSLFQILSFLARGIRQAPEFDVAPDPRTGPVTSSPGSTLQIEILEKKPAGQVPSVWFDGRYYTIENTPWNRTSFVILNVLFQTTVGQVEDVGIPITIAK